jgi:hypothetical protein
LSELCRKLLYNNSAIDSENGIVNASIDATPHIGYIFYELTDNEIKEKSSEFIMSFLSFSSLDVVSDRCVVSSRYFNILNALKFFFFFL